MKIAGRGQSEVWYFPEQLPHSLLSDKPCNNRSVDFYTSWKKQHLKLNLKYSINLFFTLIYPEMIHTNSNFSDLIKRNQKHGFIFFGFIPKQHIVFFSSKMERNKMTTCNQNFICLHFITRNNFKKIASVVYVNAWPHLLDM